MVGGPGSTGTGSTGLLRVPTGSLAHPASRKPRERGGTGARRQWERGSGRDRPPRSAPQRMMRGGGKAGRAGGTPGRAHFLSLSQWAMTFSAKAPPPQDFLPMNDEGGPKEEPSRRGIAAELRAGGGRASIGGATGNTGKQRRGMGIAGLPAADQLTHVLCDCPSLESRSPFSCAPHRFGAAAGRWPHQQE